MSQKTGKFASAIIPAWLDRDNPYTTFHHNSLHLNNPPHFTALHHHPVAPIVGLMASTVCNAHFQSPKQALR